MKNMVIFILTTIVLVVISIVYSIFYGNPISKYLMVKDTTQYLYKQGYSSEELLLVTAEYHMKRNSEDLNGIVGLVVFKDEPNIKYMYRQWKKTGDIKQHCNYYDIEKKAEQWKTTGVLKHKDSNCTERDG
jgi:hypothetical protein